MSGTVFISDDPRRVLQLYRERSPEYMVAQAKVLRTMSDKDRDELLFYMASHLALGMQIMKANEPTISTGDAEWHARGGDA